MRIFENLQHMEDERKSRGQAPGSLASPQPLYNAVNSQSAVAVKQVNARCLTSMDVHKALPWGASSKAILLEWNCEKTWCFLSCLQTAGCSLHL